MCRGTPTSSRSEEVPSARVGQPVGKQGPAPALPTRHPRRARMVDQPKSYILPATMRYCSTDRPDGGCNPSCGRIQTSRLSDHILFRKDWDHLALLRKRQGGGTYSCDRASEASEESESHHAVHVAGGLPPEGPPAPAGERLRRAGPLPRNDARTTGNLDSHLHDGEEKAPAPQGDGKVPPRERRRGSRPRRPRE